MRPTIRALTALEEFHQAEDAQRAIWAMPDNAEAIPAHLLLTVQKNGGLVAGAFDERGEMVGFVFGFLGRTADGRWKHCSHMMGVLPEHRRSGVGEQLKRYQRGAALRQGLSLITWTFDPLEGVNANLNFAKLGVVCRTYQRDLYGSMANELNQGLPSDRFEVEWWIASERVEARLAGERKPPRLGELVQAGAGIVSPTEIVDGDAFSHPGAEATRDASASNSAAPGLRLEAEPLLVEVPADFQAIKSASLQAAFAWRMSARAIFEACFRAGYVAADFISERTEAGRRNFYLLQRTVPGLTL